LFVTAALDHWDIMVNSLCMCNHPYLVPLIPVAMDADVTYVRNAERSTYRLQLARKSLLDLVNLGQDAHKCNSKNPKSNTNKSLFYIKKSL